MDPIQPPDSKPDLTQLLSRGDIWQGKDRKLVVSHGLDTGYPDLNQAFNNKGWPLGQLVELCLPGSMQGEWLLLQHTLVHQVQGLIVLLNPPVMPFAQTMIQIGLDLDRVLIVQAAQRADFLSSFVEITRSSDCGALISWQPHSSLSYTDLRKCLLASQEGLGFYVICRPMSVRNQSSPAGLRLALQLCEEELRVSIFKQKGQLKPTTEAIHLPLPAFWKGFAPHSELDNTGKPKRNHTNILPLRIAKPGQ